MPESKPIFRTDGQWMAVLYKGNLFDTTGEWIAWLDGSAVYTLEGEYVGFISGDGRLLRQRVLSYTKRRRPPTQRPRYKPLKTVPLPPMFAELSFSFVDVFEEEPEVFALVHELRPDAGEAPLPRLVELNPQLAEQQRLRRVEQEMLEEMAYGLIYSYRVAEPPVPIEAMAAGLSPESAADVETESPLERLRLAEWFIQRLGHSAWAVQRGYCDTQGFTPTQIQYAVRALLLPRHWMLKLSKELRYPSTLAQRYVVPEEAAILRIHDLE
jgi:hypothetical protein